MTNVSVFYQLYACDAKNTSTFAFEQYLQKHKFLLTVDAGTGLMMVAQNMYGLSIRVHVSEVFFFEKGYLVGRITTKTRMDVGGNTCVD